MNVRVPRNYTRSLIAVSLLFLLVLLVAASCRNNNPNLTPTQQTQINLYASLDVITTANKSVAQTAVALNSQGFINVETTRAIRDWSLKVNDSSRAALVVLDSSQTPAQKTQAVLDALKKLDLPAPIADFINSNPTAEAALALVRTIVSIQQVISQINTTPPALLSVTKRGKQ